MLSTKAHPDRLSRTFAALADPTRRAILARLTKGQAPVSEIAAPFSISLPAVYRHLRVLERAGLIAQGRDAQRRPCRLSARPLRDVSTWVEQYRAYWDDNLDRLETYLGRAQREVPRDLPREIPREIPRDNPHQAPDEDA